MDKNEVIEKLKLYTEIIKEHFPVKLVILYGSYVKESQHYDSDIDVAVVLEKHEENILDIEHKLFKLRRAIDLRIEPVIIEMDSIDLGGFRAEIMKTGEIIYQA
jgi:predicted nucleotidyltransferase